MDMLAPEFSRFWLTSGDRDSPRSEPSLDPESDARRQQQALEELADRVTAARSVV